MLGSAVSRGPSSGGVGRETYHCMSQEFPGPGGACLWPATVLGFGEGDNRRDGTVLRIRLALPGGRSPAQTAVRCSAGVSPAPLIFHVWPCPLAVSALVSAWSWRQLGWALFRRKSFGGSSLLARFRSHTSPKCQGQNVRSARRLNCAGVDEVNESTVRYVATERGERIKDGCMFLEEL